MTETRTYYKAHVKEVLCKCPKCGCEHIMEFDWTGGDIMPRKYCPKCKKNDNANRHYHQNKDKILKQRNKRRQQLVA